MIFSRLAKFVVNRYAPIILAWIVVLFFAFPMIFGAGDVVAYQETEFLDDTYESQKAAKVISEEFPSETGGGSSMIIAILDENLTTPDKRDLVLDMEADIGNASGLKYLESTTSIYDVYAMSLEAVMAPLGPSMTLAETEVNLTLKMLFGIPLGYADAGSGVSYFAYLTFGIPEGYFTAFEGVNQSAQMVYGIPAFFLNAWLTNGNNDSIADMQTRGMISAMNATLDASNQSLVWNYYVAFDSSWVSLGSNMTYLTNPPLRLDASIGAAVQLLVPSLLQEYATMVTAVRGNMTLTDFLNPLNQSDVAYLIVNASLPDPTKTSGMLLTTHSVWKGSFTTSPGLNVTSRIAATLPTIHQTFISMSGFPPSSPEYLMIAAVTGNLTLADYRSPAPLQSVTYGAMQASISPYLSDPMSAQFASLLLCTTGSTLNMSGDPITFAYILGSVLPGIHTAFVTSLEAAQILPAEELDLFKGLTVQAGNFGLGNYTDASLQHSFVLEMIGGQAQISNTTFLQAIYDLGPDPSESNITALAWKIVREGTIGTYPINLPPGIKSSFISDDNDTMLVLVSFSKGSSYREAGGAEPIVDDVKIVRQIARQIESANHGLTVYVTGEAPISADLSNMANNDLQIIEPITISLVLILMGAFFRSVLGPVIPLASIGVALGISQAAVFIIGTYVANVHFTVLTMLIAILFGVGTDYSIFILARYREELLKGSERKEAMQTSITWAGESIATSGATVIIAFSAMSFSSFSMLKTMGLVMSVAVLIALLIALTLVPAIALSLKGKIFWPISGERWTNFRMNYLRKRARRRGGYFRRAARFATKRAVPIFVAALMISVPTTYIYLTGATSFDFIGGMGDTESVRGLNAISDSFGAGRISPTDVVITFPQPIVDSNGSLSVSMLNAIENVSVALLDVNPNVREIDGPTRPNGVPVNYTNTSSLSATELMTQEFQMMEFVGKDNRTVRVQAIYTEEPLTPLSMDTTREIRMMLRSMLSTEPGLSGAVILVGGESAALVDVDAVTNIEFGQMEIFVIIGIFVILLIVLGSVVLPLFAILSISLSISWTLAVTILLFDNLLSKPVLWMLPIVLFVMLMGLGMDYNIFILTRVREEAAKHKNHEKAIIEAVDRTGGIITACAVIMAGAFGSLMISSTTLLQEFGFALSFAVLLDAMLVRTYLTPAIMKIIGPKLTWWGPRFLQRIDPNKISNEKYNDDDY